MPLILAIFYPLLEWCSKLFLDRGVKFALATFLMTSMVAYVAAIAAIVSLIGIQLPDAVRDVLSVVIPSEWLMQLSTIAAIQSTAYVQRALEKSIDIVS